MGKITLRCSVLILVIVAAGVILGGCTIDVGPPGPGPGPSPSFGTIYIVSRSSDVYGDVRIDGRLEGYLDPYGEVAIRNIRLFRTYELVIRDVWGTIVRTNIYPTFHGEEFRYQ